MDTNRMTIKEQRMAYFMENYLPKNEVLYRLPLDIQIEPFWADLVNRRKAGAVILPLENAAGLPYWYTLTRKMVEASRKLCQEAASKTEVFDPFRMQMTSAMTKEMYYTSFVEGAQISLEDSMEFLTSGREPGNIGEQMVWNNRMAWEQMCASLYRPMDEDYIKYLAYCLTDGMDNCAEDYRGQDTHPIAAMGIEAYSVPPSYRIPAMMKKYSAFLNDPGIHPLIKAAAGSAFLLVARPFPEGNERLSRMIPSAVLIRSGYVFFKDIPLSGTIARENYHYYKAMCDIIRDGNGDLTYFMEYFTGMLVRAMEQKKEKDRKAEKDLIAAEQEMAIVPLSEEHSDTNNVVLPPYGDGLSSGGLHDSNIADSAIQDNDKDTITDGSPDSKPPGTKLPADIPEEYIQKIQELEGGKSVINRRAAEAMRWVISEGMCGITRTALSSRYGYSEWQGRDILNKLRETGLISPQKTVKSGVFSYSIAWVKEDEGEGTDAPAEKLAFMEMYLKHRDAYHKDRKILCQDCNDLARWFNEDRTFSMRDEAKDTFEGLLRMQKLKGLRTAIFLAYCLSMGETSFCSAEYAKIMCITKTNSWGDIRLMKDKGIIRTEHQEDRDLYYICDAISGMGTLDQSEEAEAARKRLLKDNDPDYAGFWTLPGEEPDAFTSAG